MTLKTYFICTTPRTGSTHLCSMLKSSNIAGYPESYFRKQDKKKWAEKWDIIDKTNGTFTFQEFLEACITHGTTKNKIYAARIMWGTMDELTANLKTTTKKTHATDIELLKHAFEDVQFIYLKRKDYIAQAVSRLRAEQTNIWHITNTQKEEIQSYQPEYNFEKIQQFISEANESNQSWLNWFNDNNVKYHTLCYEDLIKDSNLEIQKIMNYLHITIPKNIHFNSQNKKMSDSLNELWIETFKNEIKENYPS